MLRLLDKMAKPAAVDRRRRPNPASPLPGRWANWSVSNGLLRWQDESEPDAGGGEVRNLQVHVGKVDGKLVELIVIDG